MRSLALCVVVLAVAVVRGEVMLASVDVNAILANAYRSDVIGPEMWTSALAAPAVPNDARAEDYLRAETPLGFFGAPRPGLSGDLYVVHSTEMSDAIVPKVTDGDGSVTFAPVRNHWTPAGMTTWYRALPIDGRADDSRRYGGLVWQESKCVTTDNVFVAAVEVKNTSSTTRTVRVSFVLDRRLPHEAGEFSFRTRARCRWADRRTFAGFSTDAPSESFVLAPHATRRFRYAFALSPDGVGRVRGLLEQALEARRDVLAENAAALNGWMSRNAPLLETADEDLRKVYWYRWFVVWRAIHEARRVIADHEYPRRAAYESPTGGWYGCVIGLPVPLQIQEMAWMRDGGPVRDHLLNWCDWVPGYDGYLQFTGMSAWRLLKHHPDPGHAFARRIFHPVRSDALRRAGPDNGKLPVQVGSWGTGAEYQPNFYQFTEKHGSPKWDYRHDGSDARQHPPTASLVRLDTAMYAVANLVGAAKIANLIGGKHYADPLLAQAAHMTDVVRKRHWDERLGLFLAADPDTYALADESACYDSFVPYMFGLVGEPKYRVAFDKFCDPAWFWDAFPITTVAKTCPMYTGLNVQVVPGISTPREPHEYGCSWNGPTWHYANSLAAEAFGQVAKAEPSRRGKWLEFLAKWTEMHFLYGDRSVPRAAEHVQPETGVRCAETSDYFHSSWLDPFFRYYCGIGVGDDLSTVSFDPFATVDFRLEGVPVAGREYVFEQRGGVRSFHAVPTGETYE